MQYAKAVITTCIALYSTRLILDALNISDYGIYTVIAGVVAMLGFITNALTITTQRHISVNTPTGETHFLRKLFVNSLFIHIVSGMAIAIVLLAVEGQLFEHILVIPSTRTEVAKGVYAITVFMLFLTVLTAPFKALLIAHENILYITVIDIVDSISKLIIAIGLSYVTLDRLIVYAWLSGGIVLGNFIVIAMYALVKYPECSITFHSGDLDRKLICQISGFAGWITYGMGSIAARTQGTAVVLNHFFGTAINAAYGIAFQISAAISFLVTAILNAMNPQLMQAEGEGNRQRMLDMASRQSKYTTAIVALIIIPLTAEMPAVLNVWLKDVPDGTSMFCRFILISFLCDQVTVGLGSANQAIGLVRTFTILTYTPKLLYLAAIWCFFYYGMTVLSAMWLYIAVEMAVALARIPYMQHKAGLDSRQYIRRILMPLIIMACIETAACWACVATFEWKYRFLITGVISVVVGGLCCWGIVLDDDERTHAVTMYRKFINR